MNIGNKIKELRKNRGITQEELANSINISFQAVSKWENNICLPDITMAPILASYFGVSMDELFDFSLKDMEDEIDRITDDAFKYRENDHLKSREILENALQKYPGNEILLNNLLYVITDPDEKIKIATDLIEKTRENDIKYDALRFLAYAYKSKGDVKGAEAAIEQIPELYFTKLSEMAFIAEGEKKKEAANKQKWISFETLIQMMAKVAESHIEIGEKDRAIKEYENAIAFINVMDNDNFKNYKEYFERQISKIH